MEGLRDIAMTQGVQTTLKQVTYADIKKVIKMLDQYENTKRVDIKFEPYWMKHEGVRLKYIEKILVPKLI